MRSAPLGGSLVGQRQQPLCWGSAQPEHLPREGVRTAANVAKLPELCGADLIDAPLYNGRCMRPPGRAVP
jgi:hypothetical protein